MKKNDIAITVAIVVVCLFISYFIVNAIFTNFKNQTKVKKVDLISKDVVEPSPDVFNKDAINPAVQVFIGQERE